MARSKQETIPQLKDYSVSETYGFVLPNALDTLPEYFQPWESAAKKIPWLLTDGKLRKIVDEMPLLDHTKLESYQEQRLANLFLTFLANAYVWQEGKERAVQILPRQIAIPLCGLCDIIGGQPCVSYPGLVLANYTLQDTKGAFHMSNMKVVACLPGGLDFEWLILVTLQVEIEAVPGVRACIDALEAVKRQDEEQLHKALNKISQAIRNMTQALKTMHKNLEGKAFYSIISPFLTGWNESSGLKNGVMYEGVSETPKKVVTANAAQTPLFYMFDAVLGVTHEPEKQARLDSFLDYMVTPHREFVLAVRKCPPVKSFVQSRENDNLIKALNECFTACQDFRSSHVQIFAKFVISQTTDEEGTGQSVEKQETMLHLKGLRDETVSAKVA